MCTRMTPERVQNQALYSLWNARERERERERKMAKIIIFCFKKDKKSFEIIKNHLKSFKVISRMILDSPAD